MPDELVNKAIASCESASHPEDLQASIVLALMAGVSTREISDVKPRSPSVSKSNVSRLWQSAGQKFVEQLRGPYLSVEDAYKLDKDKRIAARE